MRDKRKLVFELFKKGQLDDSKTKTNTKKENKKQKIKQTNKQTNKKKQKQTNTQTKTKTKTKTKQNKTNKQKTGPMGEIEFKLGGQECGQSNHFRHQFLVSAPLRANLLKREQRNKFHWPLSRAPLQLEILFYSHYEIYFGTLFVFWTSGFFRRLFSHWLTKPDL